jgi:hypothetical protein
MRRLSGRIYEHSMAQLGVEWWILSLADTRASHSVSPASNSARRIPGICGRMSPASLTSANQSGASSRTSAAICDSDSVKSLESFTAWATALRRASLLRRKSARPTRESGYSSWPTAVVPNGGRIRASPERGARSIGLAAAASHWPTPVANDDNKSPEAHLAMKQRMGERDGTHSNRTAITSLQVLAIAWRTPSDDSKRGGAADAAARAADAAARAAQGHTINLQDQARTWATPTTRDHKDGANPSELVPTNSLLGRQAPRTLLPGGSSSTAGRKLNPRFVEWLMGWPLGWTDCGSPATASFQTWRRSRFAPCITSLPETDAA